MSPSTALQTGRVDQRVAWLVMVDGFLRISGRNITILIAFVNLIRNRNGGEAAIPIVAADKRRLMRYYLKANSNIIFNAELWAIVWVEIWFEISFQDRNGLSFGFTGTAAETLGQRMSSKVSSTI